MTGRKNHPKWPYSALVAILLMVGCSAGPGGVVTDKDSAFKLHNDGNAFHSPDQQDRETIYVANNGDLVRISPADSSADQDPGAEILTPIAAEFKAAVNEELLNAFIARYAPAELAFVAVQRLAEPFILNRNWSASAEVFENNRAGFPVLAERISSIISILNAADEPVTVANLGSGINTPEEEYSPVISSDGKKIFFARDCGECNGGEEVYVSQKGADDHWGVAKRFGEPLASKGHEIPLGISSDTNILAVFGHYDGSLGRGDIFYVQKSRQGWGDLQHYPEPVNSENFESNAMYTADGKALLFVSDRPGGIGDYHAKGSFFHGNYAGNTDIYVYIEGQVINLGATINTPFSEYSPYLHPDGKTLYFSSDGQAGLGGLDVYKSTRLNADSWTEWSTPVNLGKTVNTAADDWGYQINTAGDVAYFARNSLTDSFGGSDIFSVTLPEIAKPDGVITISGTVTDPNGDPLVADIRWDDLESQKEAGYGSSDPITGEYLLHLPFGARYGYYAEKPGYIGESENFDLREYSASHKEYVMDIILYPIEQPTEVEPEPAITEAPVVKEMAAPFIEIKMNNIFFEFNKAELQPGSYMEIKRWIRMLNEQNQINLHISGHADSIGSEAYNQKLSERRAKAVVQYMVDNGIGAERLVAEGFGESKPVAENDTEAGRQKNRRVQVRIINNGK